MNIVERRLVVSILGLNVLDTETWKYKWQNLSSSAKKKGVVNKLSFEEFIRLAVAAGLTSPNQIGVKSDSYQLGRIGDRGDYTFDNCRFITQRQNLLERRLTYQYQNLMGSSK